MNGCAQWKGVRVCASGYIPSVWFAGAATSLAEDEGWHVCSWRTKATSILFCLPKDELCGPDPSLSEELTSILNELTQLNKSEHCKVALRARQVEL